MGIPYIENVVVHPRYPECLYTTMDKWVVVWTFVFNDGGPYDSECQEQVCPNKDSAIAFAETLRKPYKVM